MTIQQWKARKEKQEEMWKRYKEATKWEELAIIIPLWFFGILFALSIIWGLYYFLFGGN